MTRLQAPGRTFRRYARPLAEAYGDHMPLQRAVDAYARPVDDLEPVWAALTQGTASTDALARAAIHTMPDYVAPLLHASEVAASFAQVLIIEQVMRVGRTSTGELGHDLNLRAACRAAWEWFEQRRMLANEIEEGFGFDTSQAWHLLRDTQDARGRVDAEMRRIAELAGRMFKAMQTVLKRTPSNDPQTTRGVMRGGDMERLLPTEFARLDDADTRDAAAMDVLERRAQQFRMRGVRRLGRGPLVLLVDESSSMHEDRGQAGRNTWAKACAVALTRVAHEENRDVRVVHFSSSTVVQDVPKGDARALWEMAHSFLGGGTEAFGTSMVVGLRVVRELEKQGKPGGDCVMISDGAVPGLLEEPVAALAKAGVQLWSVAIGVSWRDTFHPRTKAERYVEVTDQSIDDKTEAPRLAAELTGAAAGRTLN